MALDYSFLAARSWTSLTEILDGRSRKSQGLCLLGHDELRNEALRNTDSDFRAEFMLYYKGTIAMNAYDSNHALPTNYFIISRELLYPGIYSGTIPSARSRGPSHSPMWSKTCPREHPWDIETSGRP